MEDIVAVFPCWRQHSEGWYVNSCFEEGWGPRKSCINCRILHRLKKRLSE